MNKMPPDAQITSDSDMEIQALNLRRARRDSTGPKYNCSIAGCNQSYKRLDQLDRHEYHHTGIKKHACSYEGCDKTYSIITHLKRHLRTTHERPGTAAQKIIKCTMLECDKLFTSASNMARHVREAHEHPREYPCAHCPAKFTQKIKQRRHEISQHTHNYPHKCGKCKRGFHQQWQRDSHERSCKQYPCANCDLKFDKWTLYLRHCAETLHGRTRHQCAHCERSYDRPSELSKHVTAKHSNGAGEDATESGSHVCPEEGCGRVYAYERNLRQHVMSAHKGRRFECKVVDCKRCFSSAQNLAKHMAREHEEGQEQEQEQLQSEEEQEQPEEEQQQTEEKKKPQRKRRKDAGQAKRSHLSKLACLTPLDKQQEEQVRLRQPAVLESVAESMTRSQLSDGEGEQFLEELLEEVMKE